MIKMFTVTKISLIKPQSAPHPRGDHSPPVAVQLLEAQTTTLTLS